ncbi:MAG: hypothetical protein AAF458_06545 [Pseudomonadota bacterium]
MGAMETIWRNGVSGAAAGPNGRWLMRTLLLAALTLFAATACEARMYQWWDASSGRLQMSGEPPSWYRSATPGPRVMVYDNGFLVDDTDIDVSVFRRLALRKKAFDELEERRAVADLRRLKEAEERAARLADKRDQIADRQSGRSARAAAARDAEKAPAERATELPSVLDSDGIDRLKAIISAFDQLRQ